MKKVAEIQEEKSRIKQETPSSSFFWPLFLVILGSLLLMNNFNLLPWSIWNTLWRFWPLLLILLGLEMVMGKGRLTNFVITLMGLIVLITVLVINIPQLGSLVNQLGYLNINFSLPSFNQ